MKSHTLDTYIYTNLALLYRKWIAKCERKKFPLFNRNLEHVLRKRKIHYSENAKILLIFQAIRLIIYRVANHAFGNYLVAVCRSCPTENEYFLSFPQKTIFFMKLQWSPSKHCMNPIILPTHKKSQPTPWDRGHVLTLKNSNP